MVLCCVNCKLAMDGSMKDATATATTTATALPIQSIALYLQEWYGE